MGSICTQLRGGIDSRNTPHLGRSLSCVLSHGFHKGTEDHTTGLDFKMPLLYLKQCQLLLVLFSWDGEEVERAEGRSCVPQVGWAQTAVQEPWSRGSLEVCCAPLQLRTVAMVLMLKRVPLPAREHHPWPRSWVGCPRAGSTPAQAPQNLWRGRKRSSLHVRLWPMM